MKQKHNFVQAHTARPAGSIGANHVRQSDLDGIYDACIIERNLGFYSTLRLVEGLNPNHAAGIVSGKHALTALI